MRLGTGDPVMIPLVLEGSCIVVEFLKEESMEKPKVSGVLRVEVVIFLESREERPPLSSELRPNFNPEALNSLVPGGAT